jgi:hypothetical protein
MRPANRYKPTSALLAVVLCCGIANAQISNGTDASSAEEKVTVLEKGCVLNLRALNVAQITYWGGEDAKGFARTLKQLGPEGEGLLNAATTSGEKDGYRFRLVPDQRAGETNPIKHYVIIAEPVRRISKRQRSYFTDESGVIRFTEQRREPTSTDPPLEPPKER